MASKYCSKRRDKKGGSKVSIHPSVTEEMAHVSIRPGSPVILLGQGDFVVGEGVVHKDQDGNLRKSLHGHKIADLQKEANKPGEQYVVVQIFAMREEHQMKKYPYLMKGPEIPAILRDCEPSSIVVWDLNRLLHSGVSPSQISKGSSLSPGPNKRMLAELPSAPQNEHIMDVDEAENTSLPAPDDDDDTVEFIGEMRARTSRRGAIRRKASRKIVEVGFQEVADGSLMDEPEALEPLGDAIVLPETVGRDIYKKEIMVVRIDQLIFPPNMTREIDGSHVQNLKKSMKSSGVKYSLGYISVCHIPSKREYTPARHTDKLKDLEILEGTDPLVDREENGKTVPHVKAFYVINGMHRGTAIESLFVDAHDKRDREEFGAIQVMLISRIDKVEIKFFELLVLGGSENEESRVSKTPTFTDQVFLCISCIKEVKKLYPNKNVTATGFGGKFHDSNVIAQSKPACIKFARVALTFLNRPMVYNYFLSLWEQNTFWKIYHLQCKLFHEQFTADMQVFVLDLLSAYLHEKRREAFNDKVATRFFMDCREVCDAIEKVSNRLKERLEETLARPVHKDNKSLRLACSRLMARFNYEERAELVMQDRSSARVRRIEKLMEEAFFPKPPAQLLKEIEAAERSIRERIPAKRPNRARAAKNKTSQQVSPPSQERERDPSRRKKRVRRKAEHVGTDAAGAEEEDVEKEQEEREATVWKSSDDPGVEYTSVVYVVDPFHDDVPPEYPIRFNDPLPAWTGTKEWVHLLTVPPYRMWSSERKVLHPTPWLDGMGVPRKHRAHIFLSANDLHRNHHAVYFHAAVQEARRKEIARHPLHIAGQPEETQQFAARQLAERFPYFAERFLERCRAEISHRGYTVIEGIFNDRILPPFNSETVYDADIAREVSQFFLDKFPSQEEIKSKEDTNDYWMCIINKATHADVSARKKGEGRFSTTLKGQHTMIEQNSETVHIAKYRAALDIRALQICVALQLEEEGGGMLAIPCTGSRLLTSSPKCSRQAAHCDFPTTSEARLEFNPDPHVGYSVIWTAEDAFPLVLWEYSHILQCGEKETCKLMEKTARATRVLVPPYSCVVFRGDLLHAGPGHKDWKKGECQEIKAKLPARFHLYVARWGMKDPSNLIAHIDRSSRTTDPPVIPDSVEFLDKFQPVVATTAQWLREN